MAEGKKKLIFDVDGVIIDPYTRIEERIRRHFRNIEAMGFWGAMPDTMSLDDIHRYAGFRFHELAGDFPMTDLHGYVRDMCFDFWKTDVKFCSDPLPMYDNKDMFPHDGVHMRPFMWASAGKPIPDLSKRTSFLTWRRLFCFLSDYYDIAIHTQMLSDALAGVRGAFFNRLMSGYEYANVTVDIDVGEKRPSVGDIVVEDCLENLTRADCDRRVLRHLWHNSKDHRNNLAVIEEAPKGRNGFDCYGTFSQLCMLLFGYIAEDFDLDKNKIAADWTRFDPDARRDGMRVAMA